MPRTFSFPYYNRLSPNLAMKTMFMINCKRAKMEGQDLNPSKKELAVGVNDDRSNVTKTLERSISQEFTTAILDMDLEQIVDEQEAPSPDILATLELLDDDPTGLSTTCTHDQEAFNLAFSNESQDVKQPLQLAPAPSFISPAEHLEAQSASFSTVAAHMQSNILAIEHEKQSLAEVIHAHAVPGMREGAKKSTILLQPKPPDYSQSKQASTTISNTNTATATTKKKSKKRGGKGSYRCTFCGAKK